MALQLPPNLVQEGPEEKVKTSLKKRTMKKKEVEQVNAVVTGWTGVTTPLGQGGVRLKCLADIEVLGLLWCCK